MSEMPKIPLFDLFEIGECYRVNSSYKATSITVSPEQYCIDLRSRLDRNYTLETAPFFVLAGEIFVVIKQDKIPRGFTLTNIVFIWFLEQNFKSVIWENSPCHGSFSYYYSKVS